MSSWLIIMPRERKRTVDLSLFVAAVLVVAGLLSFLVPFGGVFLVCWWAFGLSAVVAALLGIGLSTTSLALVYGFLRERELLGGEAGQMVLGAAMVVDLPSRSSVPPSSSCW